MTRRPERIDYDSAYGELRLLLADWDPIGVDPGRCAPEDEYDCLIPGLYGRLRAGERADDILAFLTDQPGQPLWAGTHAATGSRLRGRARSLVGHLVEPR